jgi:hypothetical protein
VVGRLSETSSAAKKAMGQNPVTFIVIAGAEEPFVLSDLPVPA